MGRMDESRPRFRAAGHESRDRTRERGEYDEHGSHRQRGFRASEQWPWRDEGREVRFGAWESGDHDRGRVRLDPYRGEPFSPYGAHSRGDEREHGPSWPRAERREEPPWRPGAREYSERFRANPEHEDAFGFGYREYAGYGMRGQYDDSGSERQGGMGETLQQLGGALAGRVRRLFRAPKGYKRSDERIREDVCDQLAQSRDVDPTDVEVTVTGGEVTLTGMVPERAMKWAAELIIDDVPGVTEIHNQLRVPRGGPSQTAPAHEPPSASSPAVGPEERRHQPRS